MYRCYSYIKAPIQQNKKKMKKWNHHINLIYFPLNAENGDKKLHETFHLGNKNLKEFLFIKIHSRDKDF